MSNHLLNCQCGNQLTVASEHAGVQFACPQCQNTITVPEWSKVKLLPAAPVTAVTTPSQSSFSLGSCLIFLGALKVIAVT
jgi:ribosomal protein S27E